MTSRAKAPAKASATRVATASAPTAMASTAPVDDGDNLTRGRLDHVTVPGDELRVLDAVYRAPRA